MGFFKEFMEFLKEQKVISVALAFIVGIATASLVQALVKDLISPIYSPYLFQDPKVASITIGKSEFLIGDFINNVINWIIILLVVFIVGKKLAKTS
jgi:large conductance mechanosensitive channel